MKIRKIAAVAMAAMVLSSGTVLAVGQPVTPITKNMHLPAKGNKEIIAKGWRSNAHDNVSWKVFNPSVTLSASYPLYFRLRTSESVNQTDNYASNLCTFESPGTKSLTYYKSKLSVGDYWYMCGQTDSKSQAEVDFSVTYSY